MKVKIVIILFAVLTISCESNQCGEDVNLGKLELAEKTRNFVPYSGNETLIFEDNNGNKHILTSKEGRELIDTKLVLSTLCWGDFAILNSDDQEEYYESQNEQIVFYDQFGNQIFYIRLDIGFEEADQSSEVVIYDFLSITPSIGENSFNNLSILTVEKQNKISAQWEEVILKNTEYVGDTLLFGRAFKEVYKSTSLEGNTSFYNRTDGVLALIFNNDEYWVLVD
jgi:hypothetical protein